MQENPPSPRPRIIFGFAFCAFLLVVVNSVGWYGNSFVSRAVDYVNNEHRVAIQFHQAIHQFDALRYAVLNFQTTNDPQYEAQAEERFAECKKNLEEVRSSFVVPENQRLVEELRHEADRFFQVFTEQLRIGEEFQRMRNLSRDAKTKVLGSVLKFEEIAIDSTNEKSELISLIRRIEQTIFQCESFQQTGEFSPKSSEKMDEIQKDWKITLEKLKTFLFSEESKKQFAEIENQLNRYHELSSQVFQSCKIRQRLEDELEQSGAQMKKTSDHISLSLMKNQEDAETVLLMTQNQIAVMLVIVGLVSLFLCCAIAFGVFAGVNRVLKDSSAKPYDPYPTSEAATPDTLRLVADKLQEAVDLLRRN